MFWFVSHCMTLSKREVYMAELQKYIPVDVFGGCTKRRCCQGNTTCMKTLIKRYKFYFAAENSLCKDYFTGKSLYIF